MGGATCNQDGGDHGDPTWLNVITLSLSQSRNNEEDRKAKKESKEAHTYFNQIKQPLISTDKKKGTSALIQNPKLPFSRLSTTSLMHQKESKLILL